MVTYTTKDGFAVPLFTGQISLSDGYTQYTPTLTGAWTAEQIRAAFADGCDWGNDADESTEFHLTIFGNLDSHISDASISLSHGVEYGDYPHQVKW